MIEFIGLWCEYDYGQDKMIFDNEDAAEAWLWEQILLIDGEQYVRECFEWEGPRGPFEDGLAGYRLVTLFENESLIKTPNAKIVVDNPT